MERVEQKMCELVGVSDDGDILVAKESQLGDALRSARILLRKKMEIAAVQVLWRGVVKSTMTRLDFRRSNTVMV